MSGATNSELLYLPKRTTSGGPRVTIVMPTYKRAAHIGASLRSLLTGRFTDFELLIRDDGDGKDGTYEAVIAAVQGDHRVRYHRNDRNLKMPGNLNAGILEARGEYIAVCHDHDIYKPEFLATMVERLDRYPSALFVHSAIEVIGQDDSYAQTHAGDWAELTQGTAWLRIMLQSLSCPVCALTLVRRDAHERYGLYNPAYAFISDVEMWMRLALYGDVAYIKEPLIQVREREEDHHANQENIRWVQTAGRIHRIYMPQAYGRLAWIRNRMRLEKDICFKISRDWLSIKLRVLKHKIA